MEIRFLILLIAMICSHSVWNAALAEDSSSAPTEPTQGSNSTGKGGAIVFGYSPLYGPQLSSSDRLNTGNLSNFDLGMELPGNGLISLRYARGTVPSLQVYNAKTFTTAYVPNAGLTLLEVVGGYNIPLNAPYEKLGLFQVYVPLFFGPSLLSINGAGTNYRALSLDAAAGLGVRMYTHSFMRVDLSALYHLGLPLTSISSGYDSSSTATVQNPSSETMKAGLTGFELRIGISFLFADPTQEGKP